MKRVAFFLPNLHGGGAERVAVNLLKGLSEHELALDLVLAKSEGPYLQEVPPTVRIIDLAQTGVMRAVSPLAKYLRQSQPDVLIAHLEHANVAAVLAAKLSGTNTRVVLVEHENPSASTPKVLRGRLVPLFMKFLYPQATAIVSVSQGIAQDLQAQINFAEGQVSTIYNPVVDETLLAKAQADITHPWFQTGEPPVFLSVGRLTEQKRFITLIQAFARLRKHKSARLMILGEGEDRPALEAEIQRLGLTEAVALPGFVDNPYAYMHRASAFVLSSRWEALPTVLIEAMACGCPVVATDCPFGPQEILAAGKYGALVPVGNVAALANSMAQVLTSPQDRAQLQARSLDFSVQTSTQNYLSLFNNI
ncbi:glycosyltransferase [filamentous cyanobacterium LEGE 11480]|uniref:Glycosyltransferase n=1 Tax=Romeriopsis navalis LEGE 11480 TaxID=2777977 RepID=A0A928VLR4_9CYAN|nr:glycosyltransferase [Romeriopsis navalis]MBE9028702.1 glycosyltransferase [Romeriopsis navalis LEGE 11480]